MSFDAGVIAPQRISNQPIRHDLLARLRTYAAAAVMCALAVALLFAIQAFSTPYPLPVSLSLVTALFLLVVVVIHLFLSRHRWYEWRTDGLLFKTAFGRTRLIPWERFRDVRYFAGVAVPFSVKIARRSRPVLLGVHHPDLPAWTSECMRRMPIDMTRGGPLTTVRREWLFLVGACSLGAALLLSPIGILRALYGAPGFAVWLLAVGSIAGTLAAILREPLRWTRIGITLGRGRRQRHYRWNEIRGEWRRTFTGVAGLYLHIPNAPTLRVRLGGWGAPRFVACLDAPPPAPARQSSMSTVSTGALFPCMLALFTLIVGIQVHQSSRLFSELSFDRVRALAGVQTLARIIEVRQDDRGLRVRYAFEADGRRHRGQGWLLTTALTNLKHRSFIPVRYFPGKPRVSVPVGEPTLYYALYYALFALFHAIFVIPLIALWSVTPAPRPFTVPGFAA